MYVIGYYEKDFLLLTHEHLHGKICVLSSIGYFIVNLCHNNYFNFQHACLLSKIICRLVRTLFPNALIAEFSNWLSSFLIELLLVHMWVKMPCYDKKINTNIGARVIFYALWHTTFWFHFDLSTFYWSKIIMMLMTLY